jgi:type VI secretion system protein ImpA
MGSPQTIPVDRLIAPISAAAPVGSNVRDDVSPSSRYFQLKDARNAARAAERRADAGGEDGLLAPEWRRIRELAPIVLAEQSKDLEIAAWLIEALLRTDGFAGLRDGLRVCRGLVEQYWDTLFSLDDEEGVVTKVSPITGLNGIDAEGTLIQPLRKTPLTKSADDGPFAIYHHEQAWALSQIADGAARARREQDGAVTLDRFMKAVNGSGADFYLTLIADIAAASDELEALTAALDERAGAAAPSTATIRGILENIRDLVKNVSKELIARARPVAVGAPEAPSEEAPSGALGGVGINGGGVLRDREDALRVLLHVADYFHRNEPQSPISRSLEETVRRARLPFSELLAELLSDEGAWRTALTTAGIKPPA